MSVAVPLLQSLPIVKEIIPVFPNDLTRVPPEREIDFGRDIIPDTRPTYIIPYRMTPIELYDLKEQLKELLDKCFIRLSILLWGAPV